MFTNKNLTKFSHLTDRISGRTVPLLDRTTEQVSALAHRGMETVRDTSVLLRNKALDASDNTVRYIKEEPAKALMIGAAIGVALVAVVSLFNRSRDQD